VSSTSFPSGHATVAASIYLTTAFVAARRSRHPFGTAWACGAEAVMG
jgi:membrane-associated phospholipid phosphatase